VSRDTTAWAEAESVALTAYFVAAAASDVAYGAYETIRDAHNDDTCEAVRAAYNAAMSAQAAYDAAKSYLDNGGWMRDMRRGAL